MKPSNRATLALLRDTCRRFSIGSLTARVDELLACASENDYVDVVVLGRFKSGKSSLLNALVGRNVLPVGVLPATAVVTRVTSGARDGAEVIGEDGAVDAIEVTEIRSYVTETENPDNVRRVARVNVTLSGDAVPPGLRLVDTPGVGSVHRHNTEVAQRWLPRVGTALVAISADQPLSEQDVALLTELRPFTPLVTIVLTKVDLVEPDQLVEVQAYVARETEARLGCPIAVVPVSIRPGHEARIAALGEVLAGCVGANRKSTADAIETHKVQTILGACREYLCVSLEAARASAEVRERLRDEIEEERRNIGLIYRELSLIGGCAREQALDATERQLLAHRGMMTRDTRAELEREAPTWRGHLGSETRSYRRWLAHTLEHRLAAASEAEQESWQCIVAQAEIGINRVVRAFKDRLSARVRQVLGLSFAGAAFEISPEAPVRPSLHLGRVFDTNIDILWFLIPMFVFRPLVHRHFRAAIPWEVEKHLHRLASQWTEAIGASVDAIVASAREYLDGELATLTDLLSRSGDECADIVQALERLPAEALAPAEPEGLVRQQYPTRQEELASRGSGLAS